MKLVSTTLTGNSESIINETLRSVVDWVDQCLVIDTGISDRTLTVAREVAGDKLVVQNYAWTNDFSAARNFALDAAQQLGADWALTLDTDERIQLNGEDLRATLQTTSAQVLLMHDDGRLYSKERLFKLPCGGRFVGPTHEAFLAADARKELLERATFFELPKDESGSVSKYERDVAILRPYVAAHPQDPRWHYYLGDSLKNLKRYREAIASYQACTALKGWDEESAWACFRAAQCYEELGEWEPIIEVVSQGLVRHAGIAELAWYAGYAHLKLGRAEQAIYWARLAITWGLFAGHGARVPRIGFRFLPALFEGPFDVLRFALKARGDDPLAKEAEVSYAKAQTARFLYQKITRP